MLKIIIYSLLFCPKFRIIRSHIIHEKLNFVTLHLVEQTSTLIIPLTKKVIQRLFDVVSTKLDKLFIWYLLNAFGGFSWSRWFGSEFWHKFYLRRMSNQRSSSDELSSFDIDSTKFYVEGRLGFR